MKCAICGCEKFKCTTPSRMFRVCFNCEAMERHRALWKIMKETLKNDSSVLEVAPLSKYIYGGLLKERYEDITYVGIDKYRDGNPLDKRDVSFCDMYCDLVDMDSKISKSSCDVFIIQHVIEEIEDYKKCFQNIFFVLKDGGTAYMEIPCNNQLMNHEHHVPNNYGNVWNFSERQLWDDLLNIFTCVDRISYDEGGCKGGFFMCKK